MHKNFALTDILYEILDIVNMAKHKNNTSCTRHVVCIYLIWSTIIIMGSSLSWSHGSWIYNYLSFSTYHH